MSELTMKRSESDWCTLYGVGAVGALASVALIVAGVVTFVAWPGITTGSVLDWFARFRDSWFVGLVGLDLVMLLDYVAMVPLVVALFVVLRRTKPGLTALAAALALVAVTSYFASSRMFEMLALSRQYFAATSEAEKAALVGAGQSMLTTYLGVAGGPAVLPGVALQGTSFVVSYILWTAAGVLLSVVMLSHPSFGRAVAWVGIGGNVAALGLFVPAVGPLISVLSLPALAAWFVLIARGLLRERSRA